MTEHTKARGSGWIVSAAISVALLFFAGCYPKPIVSKVPATYDPAGQLMEKADRYIRSEDYEGAARVLNDLLFRFPNSPEADEALMKKGLILKKVEYYSEARESFENLVENYPRSPFSENARYEILETLLLEGDNEKVVRKAPELFEQDKDGSYPVRVLLIAGDAYLNMDKAENAVRLYTMAYARVADSEKADVLEKIRGGIARIPTKDLEFLSRELPDTFPKGYIMFQLGLNKLKEENYSEAQTAFTEFARTFPDHPAAPEALEWSESIKGRGEEERFTVGCLLPLSGKYQELGQRAWNGIELAVGEFGTRQVAPEIRIVVRDTGSEPARAVQGVRDLARGNSMAIIGPLATSEEAAREAQIQQIPIVALTLKENVTQYGDYVFRNFLTPKMQAESLVAFLMESLGANRFAILYPDESYGRTFMNLFREEVAVRGGIVAGSERYDLNLTDYKKHVKKLTLMFDKAPAETLGQRLENLEKTGSQEEAAGFHENITEAKMDVGAIFIPDSVEKAGMILPQLAYYDLTGVYILGTNLWHTDRFFQMTGGYTENVVLTDGFFAKSKNPRVRSFVEKYTEAYGEPPGFIAAVAYDTAMLAMETMTTYRVTSRTMMKEALLNVRDFPGVTGRTSFDESGEARKGVYVLRINNGRFVELEQPAVDSSAHFRLRR